jgi:hypothetical protein
MEAEIFALSATGPLPMPVRDEEKSVGRSSDGGLYGLSPRSMSGTSPRLAGTSPKKDPIAPYQALPVTADAITEHLTEELPVIDRGNMTQEVGNTRVADVIEQPCHCPTTPLVQQARQNSLN